MSIPSSSQAVIVQADAGKELDFESAGIISVMLTGKQTAGALTVVWAPVPPGFGTPPRVHSKEDELVLVVDGHVSFFIDGHWTDVGPGGVVYSPRGTPHCHRNVTDTTSHIWMLLTPSAAFDVFFERLAEENKRPGGPEMAEILAIYRDQGITLLENV